MFTDEWNALPLRDRRRIRRLVRIGRLPEDADEARLAQAFALRERARLVWRAFWFWFVPAVIVALGVAMTIHPIVIGIVLATGAQALVVRRNASRIARQAPDEFRPGPRSAPVSPLSAECE